MGFLSPLNLLWVVSIAALVAIYLRSRSRPTLEVSSLMLFDEAPAPIASARHVRLDFLFWLELAALAALVLAIGGLYAMLPARIGHGRTHALVFNLGAAMSASEGGVSRLDKARSQALKLVESTAPDEQFSVIGYALGVKVRAPMTDRRPDLVHAIGALHALAVPARASALAAAIMRARGAGSIDLYTDRPPPPEALADAGGAVRVHLIPARDDNLAIVSIDPGAPGATAGHVVVRNFSAAPQLTRIAIDLGGDTVFQQPLMLAPRERVVVPFGPLRAGGLLHAQLMTVDAIAADNQRWAFAPTGAPARVLVLSPDPAVRDELARVLLAVNQNFQVQTAAPADFRAAPGAAAFDLAVMHDCYAPGVAARSRLLIYPPANSPAAQIPGFSVRGSIPSATMTDSRSGLVKLGATRIISAPPWMTVIAHASRPGAGDAPIPAAAIGKIPGGRIGVLAFDVRGNFLMNPDDLDALVIGINVIKQLTAPGNVQIVSTGSAVSIPTALPARVTRPDGSVTTLRPDRWGRVHLRPLLAGEYQIQSRGIRARVYANYFDAAESDLAAANGAGRAPALPHASESFASLRRLQIHPLTLALVVLALLALVAESVVLAWRGSRLGASNV